jgi:putative hydrolase of HD superfamily
LDVNKSAADFEAEPTKEQIPNLRTCGVARARPETEEVVVPALFDLAALSLQFGRTNRVTYHEDGVTPESDTDHTVMLGLCACAFAKRFAPRLDLGLVAQFAFVHDLAEALCGDTNTLRIDRAGREEKERREEVARQEIRERFSRDLPWVCETLDRYERLEDPEARFVKVLDKVLPKITHALNKGAALREHGVDLSGLAKVNGSQREAITRTYGADQREAVALLFAAHEELVRRLAQ